MRKVKIKLKKCIVCGEYILPTVYPTRTECNSEYQKRKYCSQDCMGEMYSLRWGEKKRKGA